MSNSKLCLFGAGVLYCLWSKVEAIFRATSKSCDCIFPVMLQGTGPWQSQHSIRFELLILNSDAVTVSWSILSVVTGRLNTALLLPLLLCWDCGRREGEEKPSVHPIKWWNRVKRSCCFQHCFHECRSADWDKTEKEWWRVKLKRRERSMEVSGSFATDHNEIMMEASLWRF